MRIPFTVIEARSYGGMYADVEICKEVQRRSKISTKLRASSKRVGKKGPDECNEHTTSYACQSIRCELVEWVRRLSATLRDLPVHVRFERNVFRMLRGDIPGHPLC